MIYSICQGIDDIAIADWKDLNQSNNPLLSYEFFSALEACGCAGPNTGWLPNHLALKDQGGSLLGVCPLYLKDNSYGELVFDWAWADAYQRNGFQYYPKLVSCIPFTPVTGSRLFAKNVDSMELLAQGLLAITEQKNLSSCHVLFARHEEIELLQRFGFMPRMGVQYHWHNRAYRDFEDYLDVFSSRKRKNVLKERAKAKSHGLSIEQVLGRDADEKQWEAIYQFYCITFEQKGGWATLNRSFFFRIRKTLGAQILLHLAKEGERYVAGALLFFDDECLYGRHWGCTQHYDALHFELCYYMGLEFAINHGISRFEPGAQGEHKISRGFEPTATWSAHWIQEPGFRLAIQRYLDQETSQMRLMISELIKTLPFKRESILE